MPGFGLLAVDRKWVPDGVRRKKGRETTPSYGPWPEHTCAPVPRGDYRLPPTIDLAPWPRTELFILRTDSAARCGHLLDGAQQPRAARRMAAPGKLDLGSWYPLAGDAGQDLPKPGRPGPRGVTELGRGAGVRLEVPALARRASETRLPAATASVRPARRGCRVPRRGRL